MRSAIVAFAIAFLVSALLTPVVRKVALATGAIDEAGGRHVHVGRIPRLGGLAVAMAFFVPLLLLLAVDSSLGHLFFKDPRRMLGLAIGAAIVLVLGAVDDVRGVGPSNKLFVQAIAALVAWWAGYGIHAVALPVIGTVDFGPFSLAITVLWFVGVINALNLIDGLDGLAAGIAFFACITNIVVGAVNESLFVVLLSAALCGALLGFLIYNFNPASIFMGDSGSMFLGFVLAASSLLGSTIKSSTTVAILIPIVALGVPITDTVWAFARRFKHRRSIFDGDRGHIHHQLLDLGLSQRRAVMLLYGFSVALTVIATGIALGRSLAAGGALIAMSAMLVGVVRTARSFAFQRARPIRQRPRLPLVEELRTHVPELLLGLREQLDLGSARTLLGGFAQSTGLAGCALELPGHPNMDGGGDGTAIGEKVREHSNRRLVYGLPELGEKAQVTFFLRDSHNDDQVHILLQLVADAVQRSLSAIAQHVRARVLPHSSASRNLEVGSASAAPAAGGRPSPV